MASALVRATTTSDYSSVGRTTRRGREGCTSEAPSDIGSAATTTSDGLLVDTYRGRDLPDLPRGGGAPDSEDQVPRVPKHASWLNMVEIEIGVMKKQCLDQRIGDRGPLSRELAAWERARNHEGARIEWLFTVEKARQKMGRAYPAPNTSSVLPPETTRTPVVRY